MIKKHFVITIDRQYGSGGRVVGKRLAEELGIHFYDNDILKLTSERTAIGEQYFRLADEKAGNNILYKIVSHLTPDISSPKLDENIVSPENLFRFQAEVIREIAKNETCIIAGRCSNFVLSEANMEDHVDFFVYADEETRIQRAMDYNKIERDEAIKRIKRINNERKKYHKYYTGQDWMNPESYDLMINASRISYDEMEVLMKDYIRMKGFID
ncbi:MAG: cytidylate kinase-like family protein [Oribacterium sp.]|nr:cytidylate kinase-like family protein [Oribacterium sp.]